MLRVQFATQTRIVRAAFLGSEIKVSENIHLQAGVRSFHYVSGGISYATPYAVAELAAGSQGLSFTMNIRFGDAASENHQKALDQANEAHVDQRYSEARRLFATSVQYDEYDNDARAMAERTKQVMDSSVAALLGQAEAAESEDDYPAALRAYAEILKIDPSEADIATQSANVGTKFRSYIGQLIASGDSLLGRREVTRARRHYEQVLELDPENDTASARIDQLNDLSKENVRVSLGRARSYLNRNRLDDAQREYEKVLFAEPNNSQAKAGLNAIRNRRVNAQLEQAKTAFNEKKYFDALTMFVDILQKDSGNKEARGYLEKTRDALKEDLDRLFKRGLQFYIKEDYKSAISEWDKVLLIQPTDSSTLEYRKRAEEKLKALEQLK
jgi:tetratricopeptide (TPR) repeat protein